MGCSEINEVIITGETSGILYEDVGSCGVVDDIY